ncbi:MAG: UMP kinase, partial [Desulfurococcaceae archaeon]
MINADLILNATDVDGIYDSNPKKNPQAKLLKEVHIKELEEMLSDKELAGYYELFDRVGLNVVKRSKIPLVFLSVYNTENIRRAIDGEDFVGTRIVY